jgi:hypothetical protein
MMSVAAHFSFLLILEACCLNVIRIETERKNERYEEGKIKRKKERNVIMYHHQPQQQPKQPRLLHVRGLMWSHTHCGLTDGRLNTILSSNCCVRSLLISPLSSTPPTKNEKQT